jgi:hypothetical protein
MMMVKSENANPKIGQNVDMRLIHLNALTTTATTTHHDTPRYGNDGEEKAVCITSTIILLAMDLTFFSE